MTTPPNHNTADQSGADERLIKIADWLGSQVQTGQNSPDEHPDFCSQFDYELSHVSDDLRSIAGEIASTQPAPAYYVIDHDDVRNIIDDLKSGVISATAICTLESWLQEGTVANPQPFPAPAVQSGELPEITDDDLSMLHYNPNTSDVVEHMQNYARKAIAAQKAQAPVGIVENAYFSASTEELTRADIIINGETVPLYAAPPTQAIAQTAPAVAGEAIDRIEVLLEVIRCVRGYPDFDEPSWLGEMMDQALAGKTPDSLSTIEALSRGVAPSQGAKQNG